MANLFDLIQSSDEGPTTQLHELKLNENPSMVLFFTIEHTEDVPLHFQDDKEVDGYVPCPGEECPNCEIGDKSQAFLLLPAYSLDSRRVSVLKVSRRRGPGTLLGQLLPHLGGDDTTKKFFVLRRSGRSSTFEVSVRPLPQEADHGEDAIAAFLAAHKEGLKLSSAFPQYTAEELRRLPKVANRLRLLNPPRADDEKRDA